MSAKLNTTEKPTRQDTFRVSPDDVRKGRNSRIVDSPNYPENVTKIAVSIAEHGQLEPAVCHRDENNTIVLDAGNTRHDAVKLLRQGFTAVDPKDGETRTFHDPNATLWVAVDTHKTTDEAAFLHSLIENIGRNDMTDLQQAMAQDVLRDDFGWTDKRIALFFGQDNQNRVMALKKLASAPAYVQDLVNAGRLGTYVYADNLFDVDPATCRKLIDAATDDKGNVQGAKVRDLLRAVANGEELEGPTEKTERAPSVKSPGRSLKNLKDFIASYQQSDDKNERTTGLLDTLSRWLSGELKTDKQLLKALDEI